jgi:hypothetical protein
MYAHDGLIINKALYAVSAPVDNGTPYLIARCVNSDKIKRFVGIVSFTLRIL